MLTNGLVKWYNFTLLQDCVTILVNIWPIVTCVRPLKDGYTMQTYKGAGTSPSNKIPPGKLTSAAKHLTDQAALQETYSET